ncbi:hypothetical protein ACWZHB_01035 [Nocardia sp. FBN12]|uniref:hypothetical protein n=1 Tax=Nocardia sp. FBN12 TaxID=3419766 RepID=UPI003CFBD6AD
MTPVEEIIWAEWNAIDDSDPSPVKRIARKLGLTTGEVAAVVYPATSQYDFGEWDDSQEPDID